MPDAPAPPDAASPASRVARPAALVVLGGFVCQLALGYGHTYGHVLNDITAELGWTRAEFSFVRVPQMIMMSVASPIAGIALARLGARPILVGSVACLLASQWILSEMGSLAAFGTAAALQGLVAVGLGDVVVGAIVARWVTRARGLALGLVFAGSNVAGYLLATALPRLAASHGWRAAVLQVGVVGAALMLPFALFVLRMPRGDEPGAHEVDPRPAAAPAPGPAVPAARADLALADALRTRSFWILAWALGAFFFVFVGVLDHLVASLRDGGLPRTEASAALGLAVGVGLVAKPVFGAIADGIDARVALRVQFALLAIGTAGLLALPSPWLGPPVLVAFGAATAARDVSYPLAIEHCFGPRHLAEIYGALMFLLWAGAVGTLVAGHLYDAHGDYRGAFALFAALAASSFAATLFVRDERGR